MGLGKLPDVIDGYNWELYDLSKDYSQFDDLAAKEPDKLNELQELFLVEAAKYQVLPLDNSVAARLLARGRARPPAGTNSPIPASSRGLPPPRPRPARTGPTPSPPRSRCPKAAARACSPRSAAASAATASICSKGKPVFTYNLLALERFRWAGDGGADARQAQRRLRLHL